MSIAKEYIYDFLTAGKCECTIVNRATNKSFTYKITKILNKENSFFLSVQTAPYLFTYAGIIQQLDNGFKFIKGKKGNFDFKAPSVQALLYVLSSSKINKLPDKIEVLHLGTCAKCGRPLTDPESLRTGLGPVCRTKIF